MADLSAHAALLRDQDVPAHVLVAGANYDTLMADPYAREVARAGKRLLSAPSSRSQW
jgi:hypothetical protein